VELISAQLYFVNSNHIKFVKSFDELTNGRQHDTHSLCQCSSELLGTRPVDRATSMLFARLQRLQKMEGVNDCQFMVARHGRKVRGDPDLNRRRSKLRDPSFIHLARSCVVAYDQYDPRTTQRHRHSDTRRKSCATDYTSRLLTEYLFRPFLCDVIRP
jgi:hypothetical protein